MSKQRYELHKNKIYIPHYGVVTAKEFKAEHASALIKINKKNAEKFTVTNISSQADEDLVDLKIRYKEIVGKDPGKKAGTTLQKEIDAAIEAAAKKRLDEMRRIFEEATGEAPDPDMSADDLEKMIDKENEIAADEDKESKEDKE